ncbi:MAG: D-alanyl-D-alanine carboxypeptidase family protein [Bacillota bacterium]|jgi:D-alanyl-D-alanine carboxypeptidase (penicillin-binding protein 5/6)
MHKLTVIAMVLMLMLFCVRPAWAADSILDPEDTEVTVPPVNDSSVPPYEGELKAESAVLMDAVTGKILFEKDMHTQRPPASLTKIMTMLLVMEALERGELSLDTMMITSTRAKEMGGTKIFLEVGDEISVEQAMIGMAVESANDAAVVVAEHLGGSVEGFVEMMNRRARELGMENTHFINPTGLPGEGGTDNMTTAYDIALMSRELLKHPEITSYTTIPWDTQFMGRVYIANKNLKFIRNYPGGDGLKTGWTEEAGYCLAATALRDGTRMIAVVLKTPTYEIRTQDAVNLLNYGFAHWRSELLYRASDVLATVLVDKGQSSRVEVIPARDVAVLLEKSDNRPVQPVLRLPEHVKAPLEAGAVVGTLDILVGDEVVDSIDLLAGCEVPRANWFQLLGRMVVNFLATLK